MTAPPTDLQLGAVGNCQIAALIDSRARVVWMCWPRLDGDPVPEVLLLSPMAGAARELHGALLANPYDKRGMALALQSALEMPLKNAASVTGRCSRP